VRLTGLIYAAIVVVWAVFLYRLALQRQDRAAHHQSMQRFSSAMRVLSRGGRPAAVYVESDDAAMHAEGSLVPQGPSEVHHREREDVPPRSLPHGSTAAARRPSRYAETAASARRRRVLFVLLTATILTGAAALVGVIAWWAVAIPLGLVVLFLFVARRQVRLADERFWAEAARVRPESSNVIRRSAVRVEASYGSPRLRADDEETVVLPVAASEVDDQRVAAVPLTTPEGGSLWDPVAIMLPTYVEKAAAKRTIRTVAMGDGETWSAGHSVAESKSANDAEREAARRAALAADAPHAANA